MDVISFWRRAVRDFIAAGLVMRCIKRAVLAINASRKLFEFRENF